METASLDKEQNCEHTPSHVWGLCVDCNQLVLLGELIDVMKEVKELLQERSEYGISS